MAHSIDPDRCRGDAVCVEVCPKRVLAIVGGKARTVEDRERHCIRCGHCVAACPTGTLRLEGIETEAIARGSVSYEALLGFLKARRSVRAFRDEPVERGLLERIVAAGAASPMGVDQTTEVLVIDRRDELDHLLAVLRASYAKLLRLHASPVGRALIRLKRGAEMAHLLRTHVLSIVADGNAWADRTGEDRYTYRAPALLLFHADRWSIAFRENAMIVATHTMLAAHALGLGSTMLSIVPPVVNNFPELRPRYGIPPDHEVVIALAVGHPRYRYQRAIRRRLAGVRFL